MLFVGFFEEMFEETGNLFSGIPEALGGEVSEVLASSEGVEIERIVSRGQASPAGFWYEQERAEWVVVLKGAAGLRFEDEEDLVEMGEGDWAWIEAGRRHRVEWTAEGEETVWLAVFVRAAGD